MLTFDTVLTESKDSLPIVFILHGTRRIVSAPFYAICWKLKALKPVFQEMRKQRGDLGMNVSIASASFVLKALSWILHCIKELRLWSLRHVVDEYSL